MSKIRIIAIVPDIELSIHLITGVLPPHIWTIITPIPAKLSNDVTHADRPLSQRVVLRLILSKQHIKNRLNEPSQPPATVLAEICTLYGIEADRFGIFVWLKRTVSSDCRHTNVTKMSDSLHTRHIQPTRWHEAMTGWLAQPILVLHCIDITWFRSAHI